MPNASKVEIDEIDQTFSPGDIPVGISGILGDFKRGPINDPSIVISSWGQFQKIFGGLDSESDDALLAKRALERGSQLRVVNIKHYTDITSAASLSAVVASPATTKKVALAGNLIPANILTVTINGTPIAQLYTTSSDNTFKLLIQLILANAALTSVVQTAIYLGGNALIITPKTGITLVVTAAVTLGTSQAAATITAVTLFKDATGNTLFGLTPKNAGADYNNLQVTIQAASNGSANYFDLIIDHVLESALLKETYKNLRIVGQPNLSQSTYLQAITTGSGLMDVTYQDLSAVTAPIRPVNMIIKYDTGTDGGAVVDSDLTGDSGAKLGVYALDPYDDFFQFGSANSNSVAVIAAFATYAQDRQDTVAFIHIDNDNVTESEVAAFRDSTNVDSTYVAFFAGGLQIADPITSLERDISELGDVMGAASYSATKFGPWYSFAGTRRGLILNALGIVNNFGLDANYTNRNLLANHQVCIVGNKNNKNQIMGNFTGQLDNSHLSFLNVRRMLLYLKRLLAPIFNSYVEEPNDPVTWLLIYQEVKPVLKKLQAQRAIVKGVEGWSYQGDQFVSDVSQCVVNDPTDVGNGKYLVNLFVKDIVSLQLIQVNIILTNSGVSFEDNISQLNTSTNQ